MERPKSVEAYFEGPNQEHRASLQKLRETIASAAPEAEEAVVNDRLAEIEARRR